MDKIEKPKTPRPGLRERKKAGVREAILSAAETLFRTNGYTATSMTEIAQAAQISRKTLFNYMPTKEGIVTAMIDAFTGDHMPEWLESDTPVHHDVRDIETPTLKARLDEIANHRWLLGLAAVHTSHFTSAKSGYIDDAQRANLQARARRIAAVQAEGRMRADIPAYEISEYYDVLRDLVIRNWLLDPDSTRRDLHARFRNAMAVLQQGLLPPGERGASKKSLRAVSALAGTPQRKKAPAEP